MTFINYFNNSLNNITDSKVKEAMSYSLFSNGKMLRSKILIEMIKAYGLDESLAYNPAIALEMIHAYSLIHDDLPAMDNDTLRRGKNTCHIEYDEAIAILAGDALLTHSFDLLVNSSLSDTQKIELIKLYNQNAGANGMIYGQVLDMYANKAQYDLNYLKKMHLNKTGKLFAISFSASSIIANKPLDYDLLTNIGYDLGLAFQIQDDLFEVTKTTSEIGKNVQSDSDNDKITINSFLSIEDATNLMNDLYDKAISDIKKLDINNENIIIIINNIRERNK